MSLASEERVQAASKVVFGQAHRLAVMVGIARGDGLINPGDLAAELGFRAQSSIQDPLRDLELAGLITKMPKVGNRVFYRRVESSAWRFAEELIAQVAGEPSPSGRAVAPNSGLLDAAASEPETH